MKKKLIIAIDGLSGVGKGTLAQALAKELDIPYLDTGLLYRAIGRKMLDQHLFSNDTLLVQMAKDLEEKDWLRSDLRTPEVDKAASQVAAIPQIRAALLDMQRQFADKQGVVMDGRDIGTVIFPAADIKLFITASARVRAERRWLQYAQNKDAVDKEEQLNQIELELIERDHADSSREVSPLRPAEDAIMVDTDDLSALEVLEKVLEIVKNH